MIKDVRICSYFSSYKGSASRKLRETLLSSIVTQLLLSNIDVFIVCFISLSIYGTIGAWGDVVVKGLRY
jgi:hypothetical protein